MNVTTTLAVGVTTLADETRVANEAKARRAQRESIEASIANAERNLQTFGSEITEKERVIAQLRKLEAAVGELPPQVAAKRGVIAAGGFGSATVACVRTELLNVLAGAIGAQEVRLTNLGERVQAESTTLATLRAGIREFVS